MCHYFAVCADIFALSLKTKIYMSYTPLHVHTEYSLLDGMSSVKELFERAKELGMPGLAITDHGTLMGAKAFYDFGCRFAPEIKPIIGDEIYLTDGYDHRIKDDAHKRTFHLVLLAKNLTGYRNLCKIASIGATEGQYGHRARVSLDVLRQYHDGLICLSGCIGGEVPQSILDEDMEGAEAAITRYREIFGEDFYLEVSMHPNSREGKPQEVVALQKTACDAIFTLGEKFGVPVVATNDSHFTYKEQAEAHDVMLAVNCEKLVSDTDRLHYCGEEYLKSEQEMLEVFPDHPEAVHNTQLILDKVEVYDLNAPVAFPLPKSIQGVTDCNALLREHAQMGFAERFKENDEEAANRLDWELDVIIEKGLSKYFLMMEDLLKFAKDNGIAYGPGRGSAAGCLVAYCLGITKVNPLEYGLLFERFINPDRIVMPSIDIDLEQGGQAKAWEYLKEAYGEDCIAGQTTLAVFPARGIFKKVCIALGIPKNQYNLVLDEIKDLSTPRYYGETRVYLKGELETNKHLTDILVASPALEKAYNIASILEGRRCGKGVHACAFFLSDRSITESAPVMTGSSPYIGADIPVVQYEKYQADDTGLMRINILELRTLNVIKDTIEEVRAEKGTDLELDSLSDDFEANVLMKLGNKSGVFQFESEGMKSYLLSMPGFPKFCDLVALNALYRPGPMTEIPAFLKNKGRAGEIPSSGIPELDKILEETYGVLVYQEQYIRFFETFIGMSPGRAVLLYKAMMKRQDQIINEGKAEFFAAGERKGIRERELCRVWNRLLDFSGKAFMKAHSVCYTAVGYQCAYLKAHYTAIFIKIFLKYHPEEG